MIATYIGRAHGRRFYRIPVEIITTRPHGHLSDWLAPTRKWVHVIAPDARAAADLVLAEVATLPYTTVRAYGPKGGKVARHVGAASAVWAEMMAPRAPWQQLTLDA